MKHGLYLWIFPLFPLYTLHFKQYTSSSVQITEEGSAFFSPFCLVSTYQNNISHDTEALEKNVTFFSININKKYKSVPKSHNTNNLVNIYKKYKHYKSVVFSIKVIRYGINVESLGHMSWKLLNNMHLKKILILNKIRTKIQHNGVCLIFLNIHHN